MSVVHPTKKIKNRSENLEINQEVVIQTDSNENNNALDKQEI